MARWRSPSGARRPSPRSSPRWTGRAVPPDFRGKVALVTGVARVGQIGHAVALGFAEAGAKLVIADVNAVGLATRAKEFAAQGFDVRASAGDLTAPEAARKAVAQAREQLGGLDVVANVAGGLVNYGSALELSPEQLGPGRGANLQSTLHGAHAA